MMRNKGFTLIEVLVTIVILAIALTAIIKATSQNIRDTLYLQNKTIASWVATEVMNEARVGLIKFSGSEEIKKERKSYNRTWVYKAYAETTPNAHILRLKVKTFLPTNLETPLVELESYIYVP